MLAGSWTHHSPPEPALPLPTATPCRPQSSAKLLKLGMHFPRVVRVRAEWVVPEDKRRGGWALKTKQAGLDWTWHVAACLLCT